MKNKPAQWAKEEFARRCGRPNWGALIVGEQGSAIQSFEAGARYIEFHETPREDPDLVLAVEIVAKVLEKGNLPEVAEETRARKNDAGFRVQSALAALKHMQDKQ